MSSEPEKKEEEDALDEIVWTFAIRNMPSVVVGRPIHVPKDIEQPNTLADLISTVLTKQLKTEAFAIQSTSSSASAQSYDVVSIIVPRAYSQQIQTPAPESQPKSQE